MFAIFVRSTVNVLRSSSSLKCHQLKSIAGFDFSTFTVGDFLYNNSDETGTLLTRFVKYLAMENSKSDPSVPTTIRYPDFFPVHNVQHFKSELRKIDVAQIPHLIVFAFTYKSNGDPQKFVQIINEVDTFCENNLRQMDSDTILRTLYAFMFLLPNKITKTSFYNNALERLVSEFNTDTPREKFVKVCFYLGLGKKNPSNVKLLNNFLKSFLPHFVSELTPMDLSIVGNATFKVSLPIGNADFTNRIKSEILQFDSDFDDAILVNLIKIIRHQKMKSPEICEKLIATCNETGLKKLQLRGIVHVFAYFAECQWNDEQICSRFINEAMQRIYEAPGDVRVKDLSTFLWCSAQLQQGAILTPEHLKYIEKLVLEKFRRDEFKYFTDQLIESALSLWMLGYQSRNLIAAVSSLRINRNERNPDRAKLDTRQNVLFSCVAIEKPDWLLSDRKPAFKESLEAPEYLIKNKVGLQKAFDKLKNEGVDAKIVSPIDGINVAGIFVKDQKCFIEILEAEHILKINKIPSAIVQLKVRLLKHMGFDVFTVPFNEVEAIGSISEMISSSKEKEIKENVAV